jgi:hypothetical protein
METPMMNRVGSIPRSEDLNEFGNDTTKTQRIFHVLLKFFLVDDGHLVLSVNV